MEQFETIGTQNPQINTEPTETQSGLGGIRGWLLHTRPGQAFTAFTTTLGMIGAGEAVAATSAAAATKPMRPSQIAGEVTHYYDSTFQDGFEIRLHTQTTTAHSFAETGYCETKPPLKFSDPDVMSIQYNRSFGKSVDCLVSQVNGRHAGTFHHVSGSEARSINFTPVLSRVGEQAATSVGLTDSQHGAANKSVVTMQPGNHTAEADFYYNRSAGGAGHPRLIKELILRVVNNRETAKKVYYS